MAEIADIEMVEPFVRLGSLSDEGSINLDMETSRALYALAWSKFEKALIEANALYNEQPTEQPYVDNRVKRLLWAAEEIKSAIEVVYYMTALPETEDDGDNA